MPAFTIFIDQWPWILAYLLIALGAYMLIFGRRHFDRIQRLFIAGLCFGLMAVCLSINGYFEKKIEEGPTGLTIFLIIIITTLGTCAGFAIGVYIPHKYGLMIMSINLAMVVSMLFYSFL